MHPDELEWIRLEDGELSNRRKRSAEAHLKQCDPCRGEAGQVAEEKGWYDAIDPARHLSAPPAEEGLSLVAEAAQPRSRVAAPALAQACNDALLEEYLGHRAFAMYGAFAGDYPALRLLSRHIGTLLLASAVFITAFGMLALHTWMRAGVDRLIQALFLFPGAIAASVLFAFEVLSAVLVVRLFAPSQAMRGGWVLIACSASCQLVGTLLQRFLGLSSALNPLEPAGLSGVAGAADVLGSMLSGPVRLGLLAAGLLLLLRRARAGHLAPRLAVSDFALLAGAGAFAAWQGTEAILSASAGNRLGWDSAVRIGAGLAQCLVLASALLIRRAVMDRGWTATVRCWNAYAAAAAMSVLGDSALWAAGYGHLPWLLQAAAGAATVLSAVSYAVAPAYQLHAAALVRSAKPDALAPATAPADLKS